MAPRSRLTGRCASGPVPRSAGNHRAEGRIWELSRSSDHAMRHVPLTTGSRYSPRWNKYSGRSSLRKDVGGGAGDHRLTARPNLPSVPAVRGRSRPGGRPEVQQTWDMADPSAPPPPPRTRCAHVTADVYLSMLRLVGVGVQRASFLVLFCFHACWTTWLDSVGVPGRPVPVSEGPSRPRPGGVSSVAVRRPRRSTRTAPAEGVRCAGAFGRLRSRGPCGGKPMLWAVSWELVHRMRSGQRRRTVRTPRPADRRHSAGGRRPSGRAVRTSAARTGRGRCGRSRRRGPPGV